MENRRESHGGQLGFQLVRGESRKPGFTNGRKLIRKRLRKSHIICGKNSIGRDEGEYEFAMTGQGKDKSQGLVESEFGEILADPQH
jgi:hypothetical protein